MDNYPLEIKTKRQRDTFDYFEKLYTEVVGIPTLTNREAIASYAVLFLEIEAVKRDLKRHGTVYSSETARGNSSVKSRPEVAVLDKMEARIFQMKKQLGFYENEGVKNANELGGLEQFM
ncbi:conserved hypothetical protein [Vibrio chagasii]|nr:conserved hypothetical protein [Vibrio chagasii]